MRGTHRLAYLSKTNAIKRVDKPPNLPPAVGVTGRPRHPSATIGR